MKQIVLILAVVALVGCEKKPLIADPIVEKAIRERLKKPEGELTKADLANSQLYQLYLGDTKTTDAGLKEAAKLQQLTLLSLSGTQSTDVGLNEVAKLQQLSCLLLNRAQITDAGLKEIAKLQQLEAVSLCSTQITAAGVVELQKALPKCSSSHSTEQ